MKEFEFDTLAQEILSNPNALAGYVENKFRRLHENANGIKDNIRPELLEFIKLMEVKLKKYDASHGDSWKSADPDFLFVLLQKHLDKLKYCMKNPAPGGVSLAAADVGNFAMMISYCYAIRSLSNVDNEQKEEDKSPSK